MHSSDKRKKNMQTIRVYDQLIIHHSHWAFHLEKLPLVLLERASENVSELAQGTLRVIDS